MFGIIPRRRAGMDLDRFFDEFWRPFDLFELPSKSRFVPKVDVVDTEEAVEVKAEIPGLDEKDLDVSIEGNCLRIKGEKKNERREEDKGYYLLERSYGSFERHLALPDNVDVDKADATFKNGVLHVKIPKVEETKPKKINIKS